jgi:hypothetical protein
MGLIATMTIGQGDTRHSGLRWICTNGGTIFSAHKRQRWPGQAAVTVSIIHISKLASVGKILLDGKPVPKITAFLYSAGGHDNPATLQHNKKRCFQGSVIRGMGFTFDDSDSKQIASPISVMHQLINKSPKNAERIFPYIGGDEVIDRPDHRSHRYVINFGDMNEAEARQWPDLFQIVQDKVLPERAASAAKSSSGAIVDRFWQYGHSAKSLYDAIKGNPRALVCPRVSPTLGFTFIPADVVFANTLNVFAGSSYSNFAILQCRCHEFWVRSMSSTFGDTQAYHPSDCFETFPFPPDWETNVALEEAGRSYYEYRAALMVRNDEGLTKTYNRFHDPEERSPEIQQLRALHAAMDRAVLDAYGWPDIPTACEFLLDYEEEDEETETTGKKRQKKKPYRLRWPDEIRDEVLARLLALNATRHAEELADGTAPGMKTGKKTKPQREKTEEDLL